VVNECSSGLAGILFIRLEYGSEYRSESGLFSLVGCSSGSDPTWTRSAKLAFSPVKKCVFPSALSSSVFLLVFFQCMHLFPSVRSVHSFSSCIVSIHALISVGSFFRRLSCSFILLCVNCLFRWPLILSCPLHSCGFLYSLAFSEESSSYCSLQL
jgi:hypothetical protein